MIGHRFRSIMADIRRTCLAESDSGFYSVCVCMCIYVCVTIQSLYKQFVFILLYVSVSSATLWTFRK